MLQRKLRKWLHLMAKFSTNASGVIWWPNLQLMQITESISGSVVPLAMFYEKGGLTESVRIFLFRKTKAIQSKCELH